MANMPNHPLDIFEAPTPLTGARLFDVATRLPWSNRMPNGVEWLPWMGADFNVEPTLCDTVYDKAARDLPELQEQPAFLLWDSVRCSTLGANLAMLNTQLLGTWELRSFAFGAELDSLLQAEATVVNGSGLAIKAALALLEDALAADLAGGQGTVVMTPGALTLAVGADVVVPSGDGWRTVLGHKVMADPGFAGKGTLGSDTPGDTEVWVYGLGEVWFSEGPMRGITEISETDGEPVKVLTNKNEPLVEQAGIVLFDQELVNAVLVDYTK